MGDDNSEGTKIGRIHIPTCHGPVALPAQDIQLRYLHGCIPFPSPQPLPVPTVYKTETEEFMERLWAFKRIKYLLNDKEDCGAALRDSDDLELRVDDMAFEYNTEESTETSEEDDEEENVCQNEAINIARRYNFVTDVTSMVVEANDNYVKNGTIDLPRPVPEPYYKSSVVPLSGYGYAQSYGAPSYGAQSYAYSPPASPPRRTYAPMVGTAASGNFNRRNRPGLSARPPPRRRPTYTTTATDSSMYCADYDYDDNFEQSISIPQQPSLNSISGSACLGGNMKLWSQTYLRGDSVMLSQDAANLSDVNFDDNLGSLEIRGSCCWILYTEPNFAGQSLKLSEGQYKSSTELVEVFKTASSAKSIFC